MIGQNALIQIIISSFSGLITFFTLFFSARLFGPEILGNLSYLFGLVGLVFAFSNLGFSKAHVHFTASSKNPGKTLGTFLPIQFILLLLVSFFAAVIFLPQSKSFSWVLFAIVILYEVFHHLANGILITFEALQLALPQNLLKLFANLIKLIAVIILASRLNSNLGYSLTFMAEGLTLLLLSFILIRRFKPFSFNKLLLKKYFHYSLPFFAIIPLSYLQDSSLIVILRQFQPAVEVGYYSASFSLASFIKTLYGAVIIYFFPKISSLFALNDKKSIQHYADMAIKYLLIIFTPIFIFLYLLRFEIINLALGSAFIPAVPVFSLLLLGSFLLMIFAPYSSILLATRNHRPLVIVSLVTLVIAVTVNFILAPIIGARGTVLASLLAWIISGVWHLWLVKARLKLTVLPKFINIVFPALILIIINSWLIYYLNFGLMLKLSLTILSLIIYIFVLLKQKLFTLNDFQYLKSLIKTK